MKHNTIKYVCIVETFLSVFYFWEGKLYIYIDLTHSRGFLQRIKFKVQLSQHRAQGRHHQLMVDFGHTVARDRAASVLKTFDKEELHAPSYGTFILSKHITS